MQRNEAFIQSLKAPFGKLNTDMPTARALMQLCGVLGLTVTGIQGNTTGLGSIGNITVSDMADQGLNDQDQVFLELIVPGQTGGIDVAETVANFRTDWRKGVKQLMTDIYENDAIATERAANSIANIPAVQAAAAAALKI